MECPNDNEIFTAEEVLNNVNKEIVFFSKYEENKELKRCSYHEGYITQEVYSCLTCQTNTNKLAGICSGCAFNCHKDHDLSHLYFKRNFRCDCGNSKFEIPCFLEKEKDYSNDLNVYNHNYENRYCSCDGEDLDLMIQCVICEDWFHNDHLDVLSQCDEEESDLICKKCVKEKLDFLKFYPVSEFLKLKENREIKINQIEKEEKSQIEYNEEVTQIKKRKYEEAFSELKNTSSKRKTISNEQSEEKEERRKNINFKEVVLNNSKKEKEEGVYEFCKLRSYMESELEEEIVKQDTTLCVKDIFINLRKFYHALCKCTRCKEKYSQAKMNFIHSSNFIEDWESRTLIEDKLNKEAEEETNHNQNLLTNINNINMFESGKIKSLPVEKQIELSTVMKSFTESLKEYIINLNPENKTITGEHIRDFLSKFKNQNPYLHNEEEES